MEIYVSLVKLSSVVSKVFGVSSMSMIILLLEKDELSAEEISKLAKGMLKKKVDLLVKALKGNVTDHHRFLLKQHLAHVDFLAKPIETFDDAIRKKRSPYETQFNDIQSVTGIKDISAASVIAEICVNMSKFQKTQLFHISLSRVNDQNCSTLKLFRKKFYLKIYVSLIKLSL